MKKIILTIFVLTFTIDTKADFIWNENCIKAYNLVMELKFLEGNKILKLEKSENKKNVIPFLIENYIDYLTIQIGERELDFNKLEKNKKNRIKKINTGNSNSPWFLYSKAEINIQWAANRIKFKNYFFAGIEIKKAYDLIQENKNKFPEFYPNYKILGTLNSLIGSIPKKYDWILSLINIEGNIDKGEIEMKKILSELKNNSEFNFLLNETYFIYSFLKMNLHNDTKGMLFLLNEIKNINNPLIIFASSRLAYKLGKNDLALSILEKYKPNKNDYHFIYLEYLIGIHKQNKLDSSCIDHFLKYIKKFNGKNYIKSAYLRISWQYLINNNLKLYKKFKNEIDTNGNLFVDADKEAQWIFKKNRNPNLPLLKARLYFDGGYFNQTINILEDIDTNIFVYDDITEYLYRNARTNEKMNKIDLAKKYYSKLIKKSFKESSYFYAKSNFQLGLIYEKEKDYILAKKYFKKCLDSENHEYKQSIDQKAQAALNRINKF